MKNLKIALAQTKQTAVKSMQDLNARVAALVTKAEALAKPDGWSPVTATSMVKSTTRAWPPAA